MWLNRFVYHIHGRNSVMVDTLKIIKYMTTSLLVPWYKILAAGYDWWGHTASFWWCGIGWSLHNCDKRCHTADPWWSWTLSSWCSLCVGSNCEGDSCCVRRRYSLHNVPIYCATVTRFPVSLPFSFSYVCLEYSDNLCDSFYAYLLHSFSLAYDMIYLNAIG